MGRDRLAFREFLTPNSRPYELGANEDANLVGMRLYGEGPFHRELKPALKIMKKSHFVIRKGDVIFNKLFAWKGTFGIVPCELDGMLVSDKFPTYELDRTKVDENFLQWFFCYPPLWQQARTLSTGSAALSKLTLNPPKFLLLTMPNFSLQEQMQIAAKIEALATKIQDTRDFREQAEQEVQWLQSSFINRELGKHAPTGFLEDVLLGKPRNGWSARCDNMEGGIPVLALGAVTGFRYRPNQFKRTSEPVSEEADYWLKPGDLLITRSNTPELVGHAAIYDGTPSPCIYPDLMMRLAIDEGKASKEFVHWWLRGAVTRDYIKKSARGTSATMKKISQGVVARIPFPAGLAIETQRRIVTYLDSLQAKVDALKKLQAETAAELAAFLPSILDKAFKGEL